MLRNLNQPASGRTCDQGWLEVPLQGHALRNLNTLQTPRRILGTAKIGFLGSDILDSGGATNPLANDGLSRTSRYRMVVGVSTFPAQFAWENGALQITVPGALVYQLYEDGIRVVSSQDSRTVSVTALPGPADDEIHSRPHRLNVEYEDIEIMQLMMVIAASAFELIEV